MEMYFDIETTGLPDDDSTQISLIGAMTLDGMHIFAGDSALDDFLDYFMDTYMISGPITLVTFNGKYFDIPLMQKIAGKDHAKMTFFVNSVKNSHIDLMDICKQYIVNGGKPSTESTRRISKSDSCYKLNIYTPKNMNGFLCATSMKKILNNKELLKTDYFLMDYFGVFQHNALDLYETAQLYAACKKWGWI